MPTSYLSVLLHTWSVTQAGFLWICLLFPLPVFAETGIIEIYSEPCGAQVFVDDSLVGFTPYTNPEITVGEHRVKVIPEGDFTPQYWRGFIGKSLFRRINRYDYDFDFSVLYSVYLAHLLMILLAEPGTLILNYLRMPLPG